VVARKRRGGCALFHQNRAPTASTTDCRHLRFARTTSAGRSALLTRSISSASATCSSCVVTQRQARHPAVSLRTQSNGFLLPGRTRNRGSFTDLFGACKTKPISSKTQERVAPPVLPVYGAGNDAGELTPRGRPPASVDDAARVDSLAARPTAWVLGATDPPAPCQRRPRHAPANFAGETAPSSLATGRGELSTLQMAREACSWICACPRRSRDARMKCGRRMSSCAVTPAAASSTSASFRLRPWGRAAGFLILFEEPQSTSGWLPGHGGRRRRGGQNGRAIRLSIGARPLVGHNINATTECLPATRSETLRRGSRRRAEYRQSLVERKESDRRRGAKAANYESCPRTILQSTTKSSRTAKEELRRSTKSSPHHDQLQTAH